MSAARSSKRGNVIDFKGATLDFAIKKLNATEPSVLTLPRKQHFHRLSKTHHRIHASAKILIPLRLIDSSKYLWGMDNVKFIRFLHQSDASSSRDFGIKSSQSKGKVHKRWKIIFSEITNKVIIPIGSTNCPNIFWILRLVIKQLVCDFWRTTSEHYFSDSTTFLALLNQQDLLPRGSPPALWIPSNTTGQFDFHFERFIPASRKAELI